MIEPKNICWGYSHIVDHVRRNQPNLPTNSFLSLFSSSSISLVNSFLQYPLLCLFVQRNRTLNVAHSSFERNQVNHKTDSADFSNIVQNCPDIDFEDLEADTSLGLSLGKLMVAGSIAGVAEHLIMFPVDTVKTRMQVEQRPGMIVYRNPLHALVTIVREEGFLRLYRGVNATVLAAIPSHAVYFASYEFWKKLFGGDLGGHRPLQNAAAGGLAVMAHDAVVTPFDVVKQRLQLPGMRYRGVFDCIREIFAEGGLRPFFASYPTTVLMNVPFMSVQFAAYESLKIILTPQSGEHGPLEQMVGGGLAGALGGFVSTPFDVVKTRVQTQEIRKGQKLRPKKIALQLYREEGIRGFFRGAQARVMYFIPSYAICWTAYETMKKLLLLSRGPSKN